MRVLIVGTSFVHGAAALEVFRMWCALMQRLNSKHDVLVIDSASPTDISEHLPEEFGLFQFPDNIGHLSRGGKDGWGRAFTHGVRTAIKANYDWLVNLDCDLLLARPVSAIIEKMATACVRCAAPMAIPYQFTETGCSFWSVPYLISSDLVGRYDWKHPPPSGLLPEQRIDSICADALFALPLRGLRNDMRIQANALPQMFPTGIDWIHHGDLAVLRKFMEMNYVPGDGTGQTPTV